LERAPLTRVGSGRVDLGQAGTFSSQWVAGYLSGLNLKSDFDGVAGTDFNGLMAWIDNYCRSHPLDPVATAAFKLMDELQSRAQRR
jgi:hypothetical protein